MAHGQMAPTQLEDVMTAFYDGKIDVLRLHQHRRIRPRHSDRQHADRASRRHVRPVAALSVARPHRPLQAARLCLSDDARRPEADRHRRAPPGGAAIARPARRGLLGRQPRPRHSRRRQSAWARSSPAMCAKSASSSIRRCWKRRSRRLRAGGGGEEIADTWSPQINLGAAGAHSRNLCRRPQRPHGALPPPGRARGCARASNASPPN